MGAQRVTAYDIAVATFALSRPRLQVRPGVEKLRNALLFTLFWLAATPCFAEAATAGTAGIEVHDATPAFWKFWDAADGKPEQERIRLFREIVVAANPELYESTVLNKSALAGDGRAATADAIVGAYLRDVLPHIPRMKEISRLIHDDFQNYAAEFKTRFPDFAPKSAVYFTVSLFNFDGATRGVNGKTALLFGIDGIARFHRPEESLKVLFDHELFHQYHLQFNQDDTDEATPLWMPLWEEGLATYVSQQMNPGTTEAQVLMSPTLADAARPMTAALARELLENLDSTDRDEYAAFFYSRNKRPDLPPRCGYYMGYRAVKALAAGRTLAQLALLQGPELKAAIRKTLEPWSKPL